MADLSPAAQEILAAYENSPFEYDTGHLTACAAVVRAAADQAHPKAHNEDIDYVHQSYVHGWKDALDVILAIAAELEALND